MDERLDECESPELKKFAKDVLRKFRVTEAEKEQKDIIDVLREQFFPLENIHQLFNEEAEYYVFDKMNTQATCIQTEIKHLELK